MTGSSKKQPVLADEAWWARTHRLSQTDLCALLGGTSDEQIRRWRRAGMPSQPVGRFVYFNTAEALAWLRRHWAGGGSGDADTSKRAAEIKLLVRREAALQLKMQIMSGELVSKQDVIRAFCERVKMVRTGLEMLSRSLAPAVLELNDETTLDEAETLIRDYTRALLNGYSQVIRLGPRMKLNIHVPQRGCDDGKNKKRS